MADTIHQFDQALRQCRDIFVRKLSDYGASWRIMRSESITDQLYIKAKRIRTLESGCKASVDEGILPEFMAIVNYSAVALIQTARGAADSVDIDNQTALEAYDRAIAVSRDLMIAKNHDYNEAWRSMRVKSYTDFILTKLARIKQIEDNDGTTIISEGVDGNYMDIMNYAVFGIIKLTERDGGEA
ncbi:MAG: DUF1599 domain-containing protein [Clostridium sp.]|nr:DUF1599 domain-containing protein [Clostridium sp.]